MSDIVSLCACRTLNAKNTVLIESSQYVFPGDVVRFQDGGYSIFAEVIENVYCTRETDEYRTLAALFDREPIKAAAIYHPDRGTEAPDAE